MRYSKQPQTYLAFMQICLIDLKKEDMLIVNS